MTPNKKVSFFYCVDCIKRTVPCITRQKRRQICKSTRSSAGLRNQICRPVPLKRHGGWYSHIWGSRGDKKDKRARSRLGRCTLLTALDPQITWTAPTSPTHKTEPFRTFCSTHTEYRHEWLWVGFLSERRCIYEFRILFLLLV